MNRRLLPTAVLALTLAATVGCRLPLGGPTKPLATKSARPVTPSAPPAVLNAVATTLTGQVKLIADAKLGLISDKGGTLISDKGGSLVSDQGGGIISNNSGTLVSNNSGNLVGKTKYALSAASDLASFSLADADIRFTDAAGQPIRDEKGQPLTARTDAQGAYTLRAQLPKGNVIARITLFTGGELSALVVPTGDKQQALNLDTASTLSAAYVLDQFVKGDQTVFNRLPRPESDRLIKELDAVRGYLGAAPSYKPADMVAATETLRSRLPAVKSAIADVKALLLGQSALGNGRLGTEVPLAGPNALWVDPDGSLLIGESFIGRIRRLATDGTLATLADAGSGTIKANFLRLEDIVRGPDGTLYAATKTTGLYRVKPDGTIDRIMTDAASAGGRELNPRSMAIGKDGTLYVGEFTYEKAGSVPRVMAYSPAGVPTSLVIDPTWVNGRVSGMAMAPDGSLVLAYESAQNNVSVYRYMNGVTTPLANLLDGQGIGDVTVGPDGRIYLARPGLRQVTVLSQDGTSQPIAGAGGPAATQELTRPDSLAISADGTLYVADSGTSLVHALRSDGRWQTVAGSSALSESGETTAFAINQPAGVAFDADGALYIAESGSSRVRRFHDGALTIVAGGEAGFSGDGGPATAARLDRPTGVTVHEGSLWVGESGGRRIRKITQEGIITSIVGDLPDTRALKPGAEAPAKDVSITAVNTIAFDRQNRLIFTTGTGHQLMRFTPGADGGTLRTLAGKPRGDGSDVYSPVGYLENSETDPNGVLGFPLGLMMGTSDVPYYAEMVPCRVSRMLSIDGPEATRIERVAGRSMEGMFAAAAEFRSKGTPVSPDGVKATESTLIFPTGLVFDAAGNMYISEAGTIHVGSLGSIGDSAGAGSSFGQMVVDAFGMPTIAGRIRKVSPDGIITTVAGRGTRFFPDDSGDNALILPMALAISADGRLAIADIGANMVRILPAGSY